MSPSKGGDDEECSWKELRKIYRKIREDIIELSQCVEPIIFPEELERQVNSKNLTDFELADYAVVTPHGIHYNFLGGCLLFLLEILFKHISKVGQDEPLIGLMEEYIEVPGIFAIQPTIRKVVIIGWIALIRDFLPLARKNKLIDWKTVAKMRIDKSVIEGYQIQLNIIYDAIAQADPIVQLIYDCWLDYYYRLYPKQRRNFC